MKTQLGLLFVLALGFVVGCSTSEGKFGSDVATNGGSTSIIEVQAGAERDSGLSAEDLLGDAGTGSDLFNDLFAPGNGYYDPNDPCTQVIPWVTDTNVEIADGDRVWLDGTVYVYSVANSSCNDPLTIMMAMCNPVTADAWCAPCWSAEGPLSCSFSTTTGTGGSTSTGSGGSTSTGSGGTTSTGTT